MFAQEFIKKNIASNPEYYAGETRSDLEDAHQQAIAREVELYQRFLIATSGQVTTQP